jgi:uncharacterized protein (TIGR02996 family)
MTDDRAFLASLLDNPADDARWLVYADWLDDRGDPRGEYVRLVTDLVGRPDPARRRRLNAVRPTLPRDWLTVVEQPAVLRANPTPYPAAWSGFGLGEVRPIDATYGGSEYCTLPPVPAAWVSGFEEWLDRATAGVTTDSRGLEFLEEMGPEYLELAEEDRQTAIPRLRAEAKSHGLTIPDPLVAFFEDERHLVSFRSVTDCFFNLPEQIVPAPECPEAGLVRFYSDSQGCLHWYLYLTPEGDECVVASGAHLGGSWVSRRMAEVDGHPYRDDEDDEPRGEFWFCAPSFAEFIVRIWLENMAWYSLHSRYGEEREARGAAAPEVQAYLDHYRLASGQRSPVRGQWPVS